MFVQNTSLSPSGRKEKSKENKAFVVLRGMLTDFQRALECVLYRKCSLKRCPPPLAGMLTDFQRSLQVQCMRWNGGGVYAPLAPNSQKYSL
jgi:hypothetical protein